MGLVNGIWQYTEGESVGPAFSGFLNRLGDSLRGLRTLCGASNITTAAGDGYATLDLGITIPNADDYVFMVDNGAPQFNNVIIRGVTTPTGSITTLTVHYMNALAGTCNVAWTATRR